MANLSQIKREQMIAFLEQLKEQHTDDQSLIALNQIEKELTAKKYGLVWEKHEEDVELKLNSYIPVFSELNDKEIISANKNDSYNFLLEGDNLHCLKLLDKTHKGKIDVIYIDPPYNTGGKDFVYDDAFVDEGDGFRHSKWLSFMEARLIYARQLLKDEGVIFISIDDNEMAQLKLLCDEVFGSLNFVGIIVWKKKTNGNNMGWLPSVHDYIVCYAKNINTIYDMGYEVSEEEILKRYSNPDNDPRGPWTTSDLSANHVGPSFPIINPKTGDVFYPPEGRYWVFNEKEVLKRIEDGRIIFGKSGEARPVQRVFAKDRVFSKRKAESWWDSNGLNADATKELKAVFNQAKVFTHPKPTQLIKDIIKISCDKKNSIILDFFAGSGTTAQAVMDLNKEDGGNRRFIVCTNNENSICSDVTYERLKTVITGKRTDGSFFSDGINTNLKYYKTDFVEKETDNLTDLLLEHVNEMIQLQFGISIDNDRYLVIMDDDAMDLFEASYTKYSNLQAVFVNSDVLLSSSQEQLLEKINVYKVPDCYFDFELREAGELW